VSTRVTVPPPLLPDLSPSFKGAPLHAAPGGVLTYTLVLSNVGEVTASAVLTDTLPPGVAVVTASLPAGLSCTAGQCYWFADVGPGVEVRLAFQVVVGWDVPGGTRLQNRLVIVDDLTGAMVLREVNTLVESRIYLPLVSK
jgi:uncharacterized repeat protein (TIGR01451 family)